jgi:hypothetical protein
VSFWLEFSEAIGTDLMIAFLCPHTGACDSMLENFDRHALNDDERFTADDDDVVSEEEGPVRRNSSFNVPMRTEDVQRRRFVQEGNFGCGGCGSCSEDVVVVVEVVVGGVACSAVVSCIAVDLTMVVVGVEVVVDEGWVGRVGRISLVDSGTIKIRYR